MSHLNGVSKQMFKPLIRMIASYGFVIVLAASNTAFAQTIKGVGFGDSLMAGYQLGNGEGFPNQLQEELRKNGYDVDIANAGVSGDTTSGGLSRLDWSVPDGTDFVILELGANDALRGISPQITRDNLDKMIAGLKERNIDVLLVGMLAPPNMGDDYANDFNPIYPDLAEKYDLPLYPFFLDGVLTMPEFMLSDGIHPNSEGVKIMVETFLPLIRNYLDGSAS